VGGWGIKNIFTIGKDLATKSLWTCLMVPGLWHEVIMKKYLRKKSVTGWFREERKSWSSISNIWRSLTSTTPIITNWLAWKPSDGKDIRIGTDPIVGSHSYYKLSRNLIHTLKLLGIEFLAQVRNLDMDELRHTSWKNVESLGLVGEISEEWKNYVKGLVGSGIDLNEGKYTLIWSWDTKGGQVNEKQAYEVQLLEDEVQPTFWYSELWHWQLPLKIKLFIWLMLEQNILTWENLSKRGFVGPSKCVLCGLKEETVKHLFVECKFTKDIWFYLQKELNCKGNWEGGQATEFFLNRIN
jgi:hypothetical protein